MYSDPMERQELASILLAGKTNRAKLGGMILLLTQLMPGLVKLWQDVKGGPGLPVNLGSIFDEAEAAGKAARAAQPPEAS